MALTGDLEGELTSSAQKYNGAKRNRIKYLRRCVPEVRVVFWEKVSNTKKSRRRKGRGVCKNRL